MYGKMRNKTEFYEAYFTELSRMGYQVQPAESTDNIADIYQKGQLVAFFSKADQVVQNPFVSVRSKILTELNDMATKTALKVGICTECPYTDKDPVLKNGAHQIAEFGGVVLAAKKHHLFGYQFTTFRSGPNGEAIQRAYFYDRDLAGQDFAVRSGLVDARNLFTESQLLVIHANLVKVNVLDEGVTNEARLAAGQVVEKIEEILPELREADESFDFTRMFENYLGFDFGR